MIPYSHKAGTKLPRHPKVNFADEYGKDLRYAFTFTRDNICYEAVNDIYIPVTGGDPVVQAVVTGPHWSGIGVDPEDTTATGRDHYYDFSPITHTYADGDPWTIEVIFGPIAHAQSFYGLIGDGADGSGIRLEPASSPPGVRVSNEIGGAVTLQASYDWDTNVPSMLQIATDGTTLRILENGRQQGTDTSHTNNSMQLVYLFAQFNLSDFMWAGPTLQILVFNRFFSAADARKRFLSPFSVYKPQELRTAPFVDAGGASTVVAESGSYAYTGTAVAFNADLTAASGSYSYSGTAVVFSTIIPAVSGSYAYSGTDVTLTPTKILGADSGTYSYTGTNIALDSLISAVSGIYTYNGTDVTLTQFVFGSDTVQSFAGTGPGIGGSRASPLSVSFDRPHDLQLRTTTEKPPKPRVTNPIGNFKAKPRTRRPKGV